MGIYLYGYGLRVARLYISREVHMNFIVKLRVKHYINCYAQKKPVEFPFGESTDFFYMSIFLITYHLSLHPHPYI